MCVDYYSGFNDAVSIFSGVVDGMTTCQQLAAQVSDQLDGLGEQIAFKRADLPALLARQQECKEAIAATSQIHAIQSRHQEAQQWLKRRSFVKAQMALSECLKMLAELDVDDSEAASIQAEISETKKVCHFFICGLIVIVVIYKYAVG